MLEWLFGTKVSTARRKKDWLGRNVTVIKYHDSGRKLKKIPGRNLLLQRVTKTYEMRKGDKKCFRCGAMVSPDGDGAYSCCGRTFH